MFNVAARPKFTRTVTINTPEGDGFREDTLKATFQVTVADDHNLMTRSGMKSFLREALTDLEGVIGADEKALPFVPEVLDQVLAHDNARLALMETYSENVTRLKLGN